MRAIPVPVFERHNTCVSCGYDLFGQPRLGTCPECGTSTRESARHEAFLGQPENVARLRSGTTLLLWSSIFAGLCPGVCFILAVQEGGTGWAMLMSILFAATAVTAALGEQRLMAMQEFAIDDSDDPTADAGQRPSFAADIIAGGGLFLVNIAAYLYSTPGTWNGNNAAVATFVTLGFLMLATTAWRAVPAYRMRAGVAQACMGHRNFGGFIGLGYVKAIYETAWLCCCWMAPAAFLLDFEEAGILLAFGALFGLIGFGILWLIMIGLHAALYVRVRRQFRDQVRGFEVVAAPQ